MEIVRILPVRMLLSNSAYSYRPSWFRAVCAIQIPCWRMTGQGVEGQMTLQSDGELFAYVQACRDSRSRQDAHNPQGVTPPASQLCVISNGARTSRPKA